MIDKLCSRFRYVFKSSHESWTLLHNSQHKANNQYLLYVFFLTVSGKDQALDIQHNTTLLRPIAFLVCSE